MVLAMQIAGIAGVAAGVHEQQPEPATSPDAGTFRREGDYWTIQYVGDAFRIRDAKGLHHLARLLAAPGREIHALELAGSDSRAAGVNASHSLAADPALVVGRLGDAGPTLDAEAKAAYRRVSTIYVRSWPRQKPGTIRNALPASRQRSKP